MNQTTHHQPEKDNIVEHIQNLFDEYGDGWYMGEGVTMAQHMLQSAYFAEKNGADDGLVIAALLHDIGHYISAQPEDCLQSGINNNHEDIGAEFLSPFFQKNVTDPIRLHVATKRYLCATKPDYYNLLSDASRQSLEVQGGPMNEDEIKLFEQEPYYKEAVRVRYWDEAGKNASLDVPGLTHYIDKMLKQVLP